MPRNAPLPHSRRTKPLVAFAITAVLTVFTLGATRYVPRCGSPFQPLVVDPLGDTFGPAPQHDIGRMSVVSDTTTLTVELTFAGSIGPPYSGPLAVLGYIDFDTDQDPSTGGTAHVANSCPLSYTYDLGMDYYIDLWSYSPT
jgi:hypothetical protein